MIAKKTDIKFGLYKKEEGKIVSLINPLMVSQYWGEKGLERDKVSITYSEVPSDLFEKIHKEKSYKITNDKFLKKKTFENVVDLNFLEGNTLVLVLTLGFNAYSDTKAPFPSVSFVDIEDSRFIQKQFKELKEATMKSVEYKGLNPSIYDNIKPPYHGFESEEDDGGCPSSDPCSRVTFDIEIPISVYSSEGLTQLVREIIIPEFKYGFIDEDREIFLGCGVGADDEEDEENRPCPQQSDCPECIHPKKCNTEIPIEIKYANFICFFKSFNST